LSTAVGWRMADQSHGICCYMNIVGYTILTNVLYLIFVCL